MVVGLAGLSETRYNFLYKGMQLAHKIIAHPFGLKRRAHQRLYLSYD